METLTKKDFERVISIAYNYYVFPNENFPGYTTKPRSMYLCVALNLAENFREITLLECNLAKGAIQKFINISINKEFYGLASSFAGLSVYLGVPFTDEFVLNCIEKIAETLPTE